MSEIKTTSGDLAIENNTLVIITGIDEVCQRVGQRLRMVLGEWFLDVTVGLPWYSDIFIKGQSQNVIQAILKREIIETPGVKQLTKFNMAVDNQTREAQITAEIIGSEGDIGLLEVAL